MIRSEKLASADSLVASIDGRWYARPGNDQLRKGCQFSAHSRRQADNPRASGQSLLHLGDEVWRDCNYE
jgi:hypothetical protein